MCGIFGFSATKTSKIPREKLEEITATLFRLSETRGKDASGLTIQNSKKISVLKGPCRASKLIAEKSYKKFLRHGLDEVFDEEHVLKDQVSIMGQSRMETNGSYLSNSNNQPIIKDDIISIHNGIVVNVDNLWIKNKNLHRKYEVDTEIINSLLRSVLSKTQDLKSSINKVFKEIEGSASLGLFFNDYNYLTLTTNTGSLYYLNNQEESYFIFASERYILNTLIDKEKLGNYKKGFQIEQLKPKDCLVVNLATLEVQKFSIKDNSDIKFEKLNKPKQIIDLSLPIKPANKFSQQSNFPVIKNKIENYYNNNLPAIRNLKRCKKCILPETMPFISFDNDGVCNYCRSYKMKKILGVNNLEKLVAQYKKSGNKQNCIVCLSGGRDSSYTLHYVKKVLGLNPIAYSYDWGMLTDLGRKNQARMCAKLGVEHILVAADIQKKREYIKLNVKAWLKQPDLGMIPLFMAGDKQYFYYVNQLKKHNKIDLVFMGENSFEKTSFKNGFAGVRQQGFMAYHISFMKKVYLLVYYLIQYAKNHDYLNASFIDSFRAFFSYFVIPHKYINLYDYIRWDESLINKTLRKKYDWEISKNFPSTWRIGDGTAAFYNYIYYTLAGFSEHDTFRSNQIREGVITREKALKLANEENMPRYESLKWYCDTIKVDLENTIKTINKIPKKYSVALRRKVLVLSSTFPRWNNDHVPPFVYELEKRLAAYYDIHVLAPHYEGAKKTEEMEGLKIHRFQYFWPAKFEQLCYEGGVLPNLKRNNILYIQALILSFLELTNAIRIVQKEKIELVHAHWLLPQGMAALIIKKILKIHYIVTAHGGDIYSMQNCLINYLKQLILVNADKVNVVSNAMKIKLAEKINKSIIPEVISMGADTKQFNPKKYDPKILNKYSIKEHFIIYVGSLVEKKGIIYLIQAMQRIVEVFPKVKLLIVGTGGRENLLKNVTCKLKLNNNIIFTGPIPNSQLPKYFATADIFIGPSIQTKDGDTEGIPVTFMEASMSGCPSIGTNVGGIPEIVKDGITGFVVKQKNPSEIAEKVILLLENKGMRSKFSKNTRRINIGTYDWNIIAKKYRKLYSDSL